MGSSGSAQPRQSPGRWNQSWDITRTGTGHCMYLLVCIYIYVYTYMYTCTHTVYNHVFSTYMIIYVYMCVYHIPIIQYLLFLSFACPSAGASIIGQSWVSCDKSDVEVQQIIFPSKWRMQKVKLYKINRLVSGDQHSIDSIQTVTVCIYCVKGI